MAPPFPLPLREALNHSISSGRFADTKIVLYSRRDSSGTISRPRALYSNSHVLKSVPYFSDLLSGTFAESELKDFSEPIDENERAENYGYHSDSDLEDDEDAANVPKLTKKAAGPKKDTPDPLLFPANAKMPAPTYGECEEPSGKGMIVKIRDVAFITFQAFLVYLYTDCINFAPYGSEENRRSRSSEIICLAEDLIPRPSPKSIYRLADKYDMPLLKKLALENIRDGPGRCDIVEEVFSELSSIYEEVRVVQANHLASTLSGADEESRKDLCERIDEKIDRYSNGDLDHAMDAVTLLWKLSMAGGAPPAPGPNTGPPSPVSPPTNLGPVESALIKSIHMGKFFDRKYWAGRSKGSKTLQAIYISSVVVGDKLQHINNLIKLIKEGEGLETGDESDDSDYEMESEQAIGSAPEKRVDEMEETEPESLPVFTVGSYARHAQHTSGFAPLQSQGVNIRAQYVQTQTTTDKPPPCSPKVIYSLAAALEVNTLRDLAFDDIQSKVTPENVITELFSGFSCLQNDIAKMQCALLYNKFKNDTTASQGAEFIEGMLGGNLAHRANAVKLGLREGLAGGVLLRCPDEYCNLHNNTTPYRLLESSVRCPRSHVGRGPQNMVCGGCGASRTDSKDAFCQACKRRLR